MTDMSDVPNSEQLRSDQLFCDSCHPLHLLAANFLDGILEDMASWRTAMDPSPSSFSAQRVINHNHGGWKRCTGGKEHIEIDEISDISHNQMLDVLREPRTHIPKLKIFADTAEFRLLIRIPVQSILDFLDGSKNQDSETCLSDYTAAILARSDADQWSQVLQYFKTNSGYIGSTLTTQHFQGRLTSLTISLTSTEAARSILSWSISVFPRKIQRVHSCLNSASQLKIGLSEIKDTGSNTTLQEYRKFLLAKFLVAGLGKAGYLVDPDEFYVLPQDPELENKLFLVSNSTNSSKWAIQLPVGRIDVHHVVSADTKTYKEMTAEQFHNLRMQIVKCSSKSGHLQSIEAIGESELDWAVSAANLATLSMNYEILRKSSNSDINLLTGVLGNQPAQESLLIMYNYTRIVSILKKFQESVRKQEYPELPNLAITDFSLLQSQEELQLVRILWEWPGTLERMIVVDNHDVNIIPVLSSVKDLAMRINNFYTGQMVLVPTSAPHNFGRMFARIHLLDACRKVFQEFFHLIQVEFGGQDEMEQVL